MKRGDESLKAAAAKFRLNGIGGTGLSDLMAAAGLTHGGFYRHFESKDPARRGGLCRRYGIRDGDDIFSRQIPQERIEGAGLHNTYPRLARDDPSASCPIAALGEWIARCDEKNPRSGARRRLSRT